jgi:hypothetical protein
VFGIQISIRWHPGSESGSEGYGSRSPKKAKMKEKNAVKKKDNCAYLHSFFKAADIIRISTYLKFKSWILIRIKSMLIWITE